MRVLETILFLFVCSHAWSLQINEFSNEEGRRTIGDQTTWAPIQDHKGNTHGLHGWHARGNSHKTLKARGSESDRPFRFFYLILGPLYSFTSMAPTAVGRGGHHDSSALAAAPVGRPTTVRICKTCLLIFPLFSPFFPSASTF